MMVRRGSFGDAIEVARLHTKSWQGAYAGMMPADFLDGVLPAQQSALWKSRLHPDQKDIDATGSPCLLVAHEGDELVGFAYLIPQDDDRVLLENLHVQARVIGRSIGYRLMTEVFIWVHRNHPGHSLYLEVLEQNKRAKEFYVRQGGIPGKRSAAEFPGFSLPMVEYTWNSSSIIRRIPAP